MLDELLTEEEVLDEDYGFILDSTGNLKAVFLPVDYEVIPDKVYEIFELFGITDISEIQSRINHTVH